jgi:hypothetical protein
MSNPVLCRAKTKAAEALPLAPPARARPSSIERPLGGMTPQASVDLRTAKGSINAIIEVV